MDSKSFNKFYDKLLFKAGGILYKFNCTLFNKHDVVNECWDFKSENEKEITNKMYAYITQINKGKEINISRFNKSKSSDDGEMDIDVIANFKLKNFNSYDVQCKKCLEIKNITFFYNHDGLYRTRCKKCCNKYNLERYYKNIDFYREKARQLYYKNINLYGDLYRKHKVKINKKWYHNGGKEKVARHMREYRQKPQIKERYKNQSREYMRKWRDKRKEYLKEYYSRPEIKARIRLQKKLWRERNSEKLREINKRKWKKMMQRNPNYYKEYRKKNREKIRRQQRERWRKKHPKKLSRQSQWYYANREKVIDRIKQKRKLGLMPDRTRNERQKRYWKIQKENITDKYIVKYFLRRKYKKEQITQDMIKEKRKSIITFRNKKKIASHPDIYLDAGNSIVR